MGSTQTKNQISPYIYICNRFFCFDNFFFSCYSSHFISFAQLFSPLLPTVVTQIQIRGQSHSSQAFLPRPHYVRFGVPCFFFISRKDFSPSVPRRPLPASKNLILQKPYKLGAHAVHLVTPKPTYHFLGSLSSMISTKKG